MMKTRIKISRLAVVCVLCAAGISGAHAAASVRALGGSGTYSSASSASAAKTGSSSINSVRAGSMRASGTTGGTAAPTGGTVRAASNSNPRLSVGSYLGGGKTVSGGSSIKNQNPGSSVSNGGGSGGGSDPALQAQVDQLEGRVDDLETLTGNQYTITEVDDFLDLKQDILTAGNGIEITNGVISAVSVAGTLVLLQNNGTHIQWKYDDASSTWQDLIALTELQGPQGIQGEKGDPGDAGDLSGYVTTSVYDADMANKVDRPIVYTDGNVASFDSTGNIQDTGISQTNLVSMDQLGIMAFHDGLADGSVTKEMLSPNVQYTLDNALSADGVPPDGDYVPVMNGNQMMWYKIAYPEE